MSWSGGTTGGGCDKDESKVNRSGLLYGGFGFGGGGIEESRRVWVLFRGL
jgi:hypothetical protein